MDIMAEVSMMRSPIKLLVFAVVVGFCVTGCGVVRQVVKVPMKDAIPSQVEKLKPHIQAATRGVRARLQTETARAVEELAALADRGVSGASAKLNSQFEQIANGLAREAGDALESLLEQTTADAMAVWSGMIDSNGEVLRRLIKQSIATDREDARTMHDCEAAEKREQAVSAVRAQASTAAKQAFVAALADLDGTRRACIEQPDADEPACEATFQKAVADAKQRVIDARKATVQREIDAFDEMVRTGRAQLDEELDAHLAAATRERLKKVDDRLQVLRDRARDRADKIETEVRSALATARERLLAELRAKVQTVVKSRSKIWSKEEISSLIESSLDSFFEGFEQRILNSLESEATKYVDKVIDNVLKKD